MKVGDYFLSSIGTEWRLVYDTHCDKVRPQAIPEGDIYGPGCRVKDQQDISKEEFCQIYMFNEENLPHLKLKNGEPLFPEETYNIGDIFEFVRDGSDFNGNRFILCAPTAGGVTLINIKDGMRWKDPVNMQTPRCVVTKEQFSAIASPQYAQCFKKVTNNV